MVSLVMHEKSGCAGENVERWTSREEEGEADTSSCVF